MGKVGTLRKRNRVETAEPPTSESKKPRRISVATGEKHKRQAPETSEKSMRSSIDLPAEKRKRSISETTERNRSEKPMKIVVKSDPVPRSIVGELSSSWRHGRFEAPEGGFGLAVRDADRGSPRVKSCGGELEPAGQSHQVAGRTGVGESSRSKWGS